MHLKNKNNGREESILGDACTYDRDIFRPAQPNQVIFLNHLIKGRMLSTGLEHLST